MSSRHRPPARQAVSFVGRWLRRHPSALAIIGALIGVALGLVVEIVGRALFGPTGRGTGSHALDLAIVFVFLAAVLRLLLRSEPRR